jgi:hypothetical protein
MLLLCLMFLGAAWTQRRRAEKREPDFDGEEQRHFLVDVEVERNRIDNR